MGQRGKDRQIDNIEFNVTDIARSKAFYATVFGWAFTDYGPTYTEFSDGRLTGGFDDDRLRQRDLDVRHHRKADDATQRFDIDHAVGDDDRVGALEHPDARIVRQVGRNLCRADGGGYRA